MTSGPTLREIIDPNSTLPEVRLEVDPDPAVQGSTALNATPYLMVHGDQQVGTTEVTRDPDQGVQYFNGLYLRGEHILPGQRKGYGLATVLAVIEAAHRQGDTIRDDPAGVTEAGRQLSQKLIDTGVPRVIRPYVNVYRGESQHQNHYKGLIVIPPPEV